MEVSMHVDVGCKENLLDITLLMHSDEGFGDSS